MSAARTVALIPRRCATPGLTIGVFSDIGDTINSTMTLGHLAANAPQIILNVGDLVSAVSRQATSVPRIYYCSAVQSLLQLLLL